MRDLWFMGASTGLRLVFGLATFGVMARQLGAEGFGVFATALAGTVLVGLLINFGFANHVLREIGSAASREAGRVVLAEVLSARLLLAAVVAPLAALVLVALPAPWRPLVLMLLLAQVFDTVTDLLNVGFRATGRYSDETRVALAGALLQFAAVTAAVSVRPDPAVAAAAFAASRAGVMFITWHGQRAFFGRLRPASGRAAWSRMLKARAFAADHGLQSLFGQIDSLVLASSFGPAAVGVYQAGMRLFMGGAQAASVLGNVVIPKLARLKSQQQPTAAAADRAQRAFGAVGVVGGLTLALLPEALVVATLGEGFRGLVAWLPGFGLLFLTRMVAAGWGVLLTAHGRQGARTALTAAHWLVVALVAALALPRLGVPGWLLALVAGQLALILGYGAVLVHARHERLAGGPALLSTLSGLMLGWIAWQRA